MRDRDGRVVLADSIGACMLLVSGANVPLHRLPAIGPGIPLTRGIHAAREIASGASVGDVSHLLAGEAAIGAIYLVVGFSLLRFFEYEGRRTATLETF